MVSRLLWPETANRLAELLQLVPNRQLLSGGEAVTRNRNRCAVYQLGWATLQVVLDGGPQPQEDPGQLVVPARSGQSGSKCILQAAVESLHQPVACG